MKRTLLLSIAVLVCIAGSVFADTFGTVGNQFEIDFVPISGDASSANGTNISQALPGHPDYKTFIDPTNDYRMGTYEVTNDQFAKFAANSNVYWTGSDVPSNMASWYEAAQFVNYLNASTGNPAAYKFSGSTFSVWDVTDTGYDASNPYRNSNAYYFLPTENELVKAAYWNGTNLQTYATIGDTTPVAGFDTNYDHAVGAVGQPWNVGSGSEELNGTFDMMGNVWEWTESPHYSGDYYSASLRGARGGEYGSSDYNLISSTRISGTPSGEYSYVGFRVASVPEPTTLLLLGLGGLLIRKRK